MREIKFRAWDKENKEMVEVELLGKRVLLVKDGEWENIENFEVMQYTGLKDKNGKEIYEGDIVNCFRHEGFEFVTTRLGAHGIETQLGFYPFIEVYGYAEVLGNIYENPELLDNASN